MRFCYQFSVVIICLVLVLFSCGKRGADGPKIGGDDSGDTVVIKKMMVPVKIASDKLTTEYFYEPKGAMLKEIRISTGYRYLFFYTENRLLLRAEIHVKDKQVFLADYRRDKAGKLTKVTTFDLHEKVFTPTGYYTVLYNSNNQLTRIGSVDAISPLFNEKLFEFDTYGNVKHMKVVNGSKTTTSDLTYDDKNGIYKNVLYAELIFLVFDDLNFLHANHNIINCTNEQMPSENIQTSYEYDEAGFPVKMVVTKDKNKDTYKITYKTVTME